MSYIDLLNDFWRDDRFDPMPPMDCKFYFYLINMCNSRGWINPFELQSRIIELSLVIGRKTIGEVRNRLKQRGLIDFVAANNKPTIYLLNKVEVNDAKCLLKCFPQVTIRKHLRLQLGNIYGNISETYNIDNKNKDYKTEEEGAPRTRTREKFLEDFIRGNEITLDSFCKNEGTDVGGFRQTALAVLTEWELRGWAPAEIKRSDNGEYSAGHLINQVRVKLNNKNRKNNGSDREDRFQRRRGTETAAACAADYSEPL